MRPLTRLVNTTAAPSTSSEIRGGNPNAAFVIVKNTKPSWQAVLSLLIVLGAAVVFTSLVSGLTYVLRWSARAWRVAHGAA